MFKTFTPNDLLQFAYNDPNLLDKEELAAEIPFCESLSDRLDEIYEIQNELNKAIESAPEGRVTSILNFSKSLKVKKSELLYQNVEMNFN